MKKTMGDRSMTQNLSNIKSDYTVISNLVEQPYMKSVGFVVI
ncbi:hypothetical protein [Okeania sp. SIO2C2]|nr:hypothetical protein [Okeania sp. SIO2C2]